MVSGNDDAQKSIGIGHHGIVPSLPSIAVWVRWLVLIGDDLNSDLVNVMLAKNTDHK